MALVMAASTSIAAVAVTQPPRCTSERLTFAGDDPAGLCLPKLGVSVSAAASSRCGMSCSSSSAFLGERLLPSSWSGRRDDRHSSPGTNFGVVREKSSSSSTSHSSPPIDPRKHREAGDARKVTAEMSPSAAAAFSGTPVRKTSILVVGATGTLGRQIVRRALDEGYDVRCLVRTRQSPADFLRDWGATTVSGDLSKPETLAAALVGIHTVIDCATGRPEEPIRTVDWDGKVALIQCAKAMGIQRFIFFSIHNCDKHPEVPLMEIKRCTEKYLAQSGLSYSILRLCGFMQGLIGQYAVPILEEKSVWGTDASTRVSYMDTQDIARMTMSALRSEQTVGKTLTLAGPRAWTTQEVIALCERLAGQDAKVTTVPVAILKVTRQLTRLFEWSGDAADRLAFSEVLSSDAVFSAPMGDVYSLLNMDPNETTTLEVYLREYYQQILRKLKDLKASSKQGDFYL